MYGTGTPGTEPEPVLRARRWRQKANAVRADVVLEYAAKFSPDGKWVVYRSNESGRQEVWIAPFPGPGKRTQVSTDGVLLAYPRWRGREVFFLDASGRLMAAPIDVQGSEVRVGAVVPLFDSRARLNTIYPYDVTADGQRFLINMSLEDQSPATTSITLLVNWMAALANK